MSHFNQRKEKNCLNCNAVVAGHYCQVCGQENIEPKESFWHIITHFFNDITHFDGKLFSTTKYLLLKPGFLPREYLRGKRASYLHPIRMYVFMSAIFFLIFFSITGSEDMIKTNGSDDKKGSNEKKLDDIDSLMADTKDTAILSVLAKQKHWYELKNEAIDSLYNALAEAKASKKQAKADGGNTTVVIAKEDSLLQNLRDSAEQEKVSGYDYSPSYPDSITTIEKYEQYQAGLLPEKRDGWLKSIFLKKQISIKKKFRYDSKEFLVVISDKFLHSLPQMLFISLPLFAWVLQLLYMRRKQFYYTDHAVFSIYHFIAVFIIMLVLLFFDKLADLSGWKVFKYLSGACLIFILFYLYKSMRNFYQQTRGKTLLKFVLLCMISGIITSLLTVGFLLLTFFKV